MASRRTLFPLKLNETFESPPDIETPGQTFFISAQASINERPYSLCSSIPVATAKTFGSKIMSLGSISTVFSRISYARLHISTFLCNVSA